MNTRTTHDYTPTLNGSREQNAAYNARREMLNLISNSTVPKRRSRRPGRSAAMRKLASL